MSLKIKNRLYLAFFPIIFFFFTTTNGYSTIDVTIPALNVYPGSQALVPVQVSDLTNQKVYSIGAEITFDAEILKATALVIDGCLLQEWGAPTINIGSGSILLGVAGSFPLVGNGVLFYINFTVTGSAGSFSPVLFKSFVFNEGMPEAATSNGNLTVVTETEGSILAVNPDSINLTLTCNEVNPAPELLYIYNAGTGVLDWVATESAEWLTLSCYSGRDSDSVAIFFNNTGLSAGSYSDSVIISATGADSSPQIVYVTLNIEPQPVIIVSIPDSSFTFDSRFSLPIIISDITNLEIKSIRLSLIFNPLLLEGSGVNTTGALTEIWGAPAVTVSPGQIDAEIQGSIPLSGSGVLCWIDLHVLGSGGSNCEIKFNEFLLNDVILADSLQNGNIYIKIPNDISKTPPAPENYYLWQNYPNPFNPVTRIKYHVARPSLVKIDIFDINGKLVKNLVQNYQNAGTFEISWHGDDNFSGKVASGIYYCRYESDVYIQTRLITLIK